MPINLASEFKSSRMTKIELLNADRSRTLHNVTAVIVTYNPCLNNLTQLLNKLSTQVSNIVIVDNSFLPEIDKIRKIFKCSICQLHLIFNHRNLGIAAALNKGIKFSLSQIPATNFFILFDQDSLPFKNYVEILLKLYDELKQTGRKIAAIGGQPKDIKGLPTKFIINKGLMLVPAKFSMNTNYTKVDHLTTSGCLIPSDVFSVVGLMESKLFIDYIDIEWCLRAHSKGYEVYGTISATFNHNLGDKTLNILGKTLPLHQDFRYFYLFRNGIFLLSCSHINIRRRLTELIRLVKIFFLYGLLSKDSSPRLKFILEGIKAGIFKRLNSGQNGTSKKSQ